MPWRMYFSPRSTSMIGPGPGRSMRGGREMAANAAGSFGAWSRYGYPPRCLRVAQQQNLADALFAASRKSYFELHFGKGLAVAPPEALDAAKDTATNPAVLTAFALAIVADAQGPAYPGIPGFEPTFDRGRARAARVRQCVDQLRVMVPNRGAYVSESNYFEHEFQQAYWGSNYPRLAEIKQKYDPDGLFFVHNGVGSEHWSPDGFTKL
jgi:FAD/FMN-containing dehydrogenase